jgi:hypothetical protein
MARVLHWSQGDIEANTEALRTMIADEKRLKKPRKLPVVIYQPLPPRRVSRTNQDKRRAA